MDKLGPWDDRMNRGSRSFWVVMNGSGWVREGLFYNNPQAEAWGYTDEACLRRL